MCSASSSLRIEKKKKIHPPVGEYSQYNIDKTGKYGIRQGKARRILLCNVPLDVDWVLIHRELVALGLARVRHVAAPTGSHPAGALLPVAAARRGVAGLPAALAVLVVGDILGARCRISSTCSDKDRSE
jgi:hypothetical protein